MNRALIIIVIVSIALASLGIQVSVSSMPWATVGGSLMQGFMNPVYRCLVEMLRLGNPADLYNRLLNQQIITRTYINITKIRTNITIDTTYVPIDLGSIPITPPNGFKIVSAFMNRGNGIRYALLTDSNNTRYKLAIVRDSSTMIIDLKFMKIGERVNESISIIRTCTPRGLENITYIRRCRIESYRIYTDEPLSQEVTQDIANTIRVYIECTIEIVDPIAGPFIRVAAAAEVEYIPNSMIIYAVDRSWEWHALYMVKCSFNPKLEWNTYVVHVRAEGHYFNTIACPFIAIHNWPWADLVFHLDGTMDCRANDAPNIGFCTC